MFIDGLIFDSLRTAPTLLRAIRTSSDDPAFRALVTQLDMDLAARDGEDNAFYAQFNSIDPLRHVVLVLDGDEAVGCGALKPFGPDGVEIKRMYTEASHRRRGVASIVLNELERWAKELGYARCVLETGRRQPEAIALYERHGYTGIPNYGPYVGVENSRCFEKVVG